VSWSETLKGKTKPSLKLPDPDEGDTRKDAVRRVRHALTKEEESLMLKLVNSREYCDFSPHKIVAMLADKAVYIASERTFYRVMVRSSMPAHRHKSRPPVSPKRPQLRATDPGQVWSWDISYLKSDVRGRFYYLYIFFDIFSRKILG
jgi:transposase InsO family protein